MTLLQNLKIGIQAAFILCFLLFFFLFANNLYAQNPMHGRSSAGAKQQPTAKKEPPIELLPGAGVLIGDVIKGENVRKVLMDSLTKTQIGFRQGGAMMFCDSAIQYIGRNVVHAFGRIYLIDADSTTAIGDSLFYDGNTRTARLRGNVILRDKDKTVTTNRLDYNLATKIANYSGGGTVQDDSSRLTSRIGYYNTITKVANFRGDVYYKSPETELSGDTLTYNARSKIVYFNSRTRIKTRNGDIITDKGEYNTVLGKSNFKGRTKIDTDEYIISGDALEYDRVMERGFAKGNVEFYNKKDNFIILGDFTRYDGVLETSQVYGNAVLISPQKNGKDTLFLAADTLISYKEAGLADSLPAVKKLTAYRNVRIYRSDFQSKCDSLGYHLNDSTIFFYYDPVIWARGSQLVAKQISVRMKNSQIDSMSLQEKAFIVSQDTLLNFNQTKGKNIDAKFDKGELRRVLVSGNGESIYHILENDTLFIGLNYVKCSDMIITFNDSAQLQDILFIKQPEGKFIPPHEIKQENKFLDDFNWRSSEKPAKGVVLGIHAANQYRSGDLKGALMIVDDFFKVFLKDNRLIFYRLNADATDIQPEFFVHVYPKNKNDLPIDKRKAGYEDVGFRFPPDHLQNGIAKYDLVLPEFKSARVVVGQYGDKKKVLWQKSYNFK
jgi:lipopolysaccharide export system protein LptA